MSKLNIIKTFRVDHHEDGLLAKLVAKWGLNESTVIRLAMRKLSLTEIDKPPNDQGLG
jgi:hypothetical protein